MSGDALLDSNAVVAFWAQDAALIQKLLQINEVFVPAIVVGELYFGAQKSAQRLVNVARVGELVQNNVVLPCDEQTASVYGGIKNALRAKGKPIPENDIWIAASALQHSLTLVTRDAHFAQIDGLTTEDW